MKILLTTGEKISVEKFLVSQTYTGCIEGNPVEISKNIRLDLKTRIEHEFGYSRTLKILDDHQPTLPKYRVIAYLESMDPVNKDMDYSYLTLCWFQDDFPEDIMKAIQNKLSKVSWVKCARDAYWF